MKLTRNKSRCEAEPLNKETFHLGLPVAVVVIVLCFSGCGPVAKIVKSAGKALKSSAKSSGKVGDDAAQTLSHTSDDAARSIRNNTRKGNHLPAKSVSAAARTNASIRSATQSIRTASASTGRCGERLTRLVQSYDFLSPASRVAFRVLHVIYLENQKRLEELNKELENSSLSEARAEQIKSECAEIEESNRRIEAKINQLYAELG